MHFAHAVNAPGVEEHPFGRGGLTGVNMGNDADIAVFFYWELTFHMLDSGCLNRFTYCLMLLFQ
jgi:hypothetical protein